MLEVTSIIQLWALENKTAINTSDQKLKTALAKIKVEHRQCKIERKEVEEESDDHDNTKAFDSVNRKKEYESQVRNGGA